MKLLKLFKRKPEPMPQSELELFNSQAGKWLRVYRRQSYAKIVVMIVVAASVLWSQGDTSEKPDGTYITSINLSGTIDGGVSGTGYEFSREFIKATKDPKSRGILIMANSRGGSPLQSQIVFDTIYQYTQSDMAVEGKEGGRQPVWVSIQDICASACMHAVAPADKIIASGASSVVGSIGVKMEGWDFTGLMEQVGVKRRIISLGEHKSAFSPYAEDSPQERQLLMDSLVKPMYQKFVSDMKLARGTKLDTSNDRLFSGMAWASVEAQKLGLIDTITNPLTVEQEFKQLTQAKTVYRDRESPFSFSNVFGAAVEYAVNEL